MLFSSQNLSSTQPGKLLSEKKKIRSQAIQLRIARRLVRCAQVIGPIEKEHTIHYTSQGEWSMHELLECILTQTGRARVYLATWSISEPGASKLIDILERGLISELYGIMDWRVKVRCPKAYQVARYNFSKIHLTTCHSKVTVIQNDAWNISIVGSANYTNNPRIETGVITENLGVCDFHKNWILNVIDQSDPFE